MKGVDWDALAAAAPLNRDASIARDGSGEIFTPLKRGLKERQFTEIPPLRAHPPDPGFVDMTGRKIGRLTVVGYLGKGHKGALWLVRCACGAFERRVTRTLKRSAVDGRNDRCGECGYLDELRNGRVNLPDDRLFANRKGGA